MSKTDNRPSHRVYAVTKNGERSFWQPIGAAWVHSDGWGFNVKIDYLPLERRGNRHSQAEGRRGRRTGRRNRLIFRAAFGRPFAVWGLNSLSFNQINKNTVCRP